jgi:DNA polymerase elongation subunit (family B)
MSTNYFFSYYWHIDTEETEITKIRIYGLDKNNKNVCLIVKDFTPYVYIELPEDIQWDETKARQLVDRINFLLGEKKPLKTSLMFKKRLYYVNNDNNGNRKLYPYLFCSFSNSGDINFLNKICRNRMTLYGIGSLFLKIHENNASPILQLISVKKIPVTGWINFTGKLLKNKETDCEFEYEVSWKKLENRESDDVARPLLMGYDIEVNSSIPNTFPKANRPDDKIFQCSLVFLRQGDEIEKAEKILLTLNDVDENILENVKVYRYVCEADLLMGFVSLIKEKQPNICIGYNIFGFDIPYMIDRANINLITYDFDKQGMSKNGHGKQKSIKWSSSAYKNQEFTFLEAEGRIFVDLLPLAKRDMKLSSYTLDNVSIHVLKDMKKESLSKDGIFECYKLGLEKDEQGNFTKQAKKAMAMVGKYCVKDSVLVVKLFETLTYWIALCEMSKLTGVPIFSLYTQGQQLKIFSQVYRKATNENIVVERDAYKIKENDHYVGATVFPPVPGMYDKVLPFDFCLAGDTMITLHNGISKRIDSFRGDEVVLGFDGKGFSSFSCINGLRYKGKKETVVIWLDNGVSIKSTPDHKFMLDNGSWCRADELKNKFVKTIIDSKQVINVAKGEIEDVYDIEVEKVNNFLANGVVAHNCSLYPSAIIANNLCWSTLVLDDKIPDELCNVMTWNDHINCIAKGTLITVGNYYLPIEELYENKENILSYSEEQKKFVYSKQINFFDRGIKECIRLTFSDKTHLDCTSDHKILLKNGDWIEAEKIELNKDILLLGQIIITRKNIGKREVYDLEVENTNNFIANGIVVHNCSHDPKIKRKAELDTIIKSYDEKTKILRKERDKKANFFKKEDIKKEIENIIKETKPYREERSQLSKTKSKYTICCERKFRWLKSPKGVLPEILDNLMKTRTKTKNEMKIVKNKIKDSPEGEQKKALMTYYDVLDQRQLALKISCNSGYGITGARQGYLICMPVAMCTTYMGRCAIEKASKLIQEEHKGVLVYGDSVSSDTPIFYMNKRGNFNVKSIKDLCSNFVPYEQFKKDEEGLVCKEQSAVNLGIKVWTHNGWSVVKRVIRHKTNKKMFRIITRNGCVDVTEDHSLITKTKEQIKPGYCKTGLELLHSVPDITTLSGTILSEKEAFMYGYFFINGSTYTDTDYNVWSIDCEGDENIKNIMEKIEPYVKFVFRENILYSDSTIYMSEKYEKLFFKSGYKSIPSCIFTAPLNIKKMFIFGCGCQEKELHFANKIQAQSLYILMKSVYPNTELHCIEPVFKTQWNSDCMFYKIIRNGKLNQDSIIKIKKIPKKDDFVYDLETEEGVFHAGIGSLIVKNTDSNYVSFPHLNTAQECWDYAINVAKQVSKTFPPPMELAFENKIYWRYFLLTKKRYMSIACERDGKLDDKISKKGVLLQRRDNSSFVRNTYELLVLKIFNKEPMENVLLCLIEQLNKLFSRYFDYEHFVVTKSVGNIGLDNYKKGDDISSFIVKTLNDKGKECYKLGDYTIKIVPEDEDEKNKKYKLKQCDNDNEFYIKSLPAQCQLAEKMRNRGQMVANGSRIEYVITTNGGHVAKQYDKIEDIEYFKRFSEILSLDYLYYLKQFTNPMDQVLNIIYKGKIKDFTLNQYKIRLQKYKSIEEIKKLFCPRIQVL